MGRKMLNVRYDQSTREWVLYFLDKALPTQTWPTLNEVRAYWASMNVHLRPDGENRYRLTEPPFRWPVLDEAA
jgi:hypothetical protein